MEQEIIDKFINYLQLKVSNFKINKRGIVKIFTCPSCNSLHCSFKGKTSKITCMKCSFEGDVETVVKLLEPQLKTEKEVTEYVKNLLGISITEEEKSNILDFYYKNNFDITPIVKGGKRPLEKDWTNKEHKDIRDWERWVELGLNIGIKTGACSNITVIDIDLKDIPEELKPLLNKTLIQETPNGWHYFYKYEPELRKTRINSLSLDIETDGGQVVANPSITDGEMRSFVELSDIESMDEELKNFLLKKIKGDSKTTSTAVATGFTPGSEDFQFGMVDEGGRNTTMMHFGGILRKKLNIRQTEYALSLMNKTFFKPPLSHYEFKNAIECLSRYDGYDEKELAKEVLNYIIMVEEATSKDIEQALEEKKDRIDSALAYLTREEYIYRKGRMYKPFKKPMWATNLADIGVPIDFKVPFFDDVAEFNWGDLLLLGAGTKYGKTTIAIGIIADLVKQGKTPYYFYSEPGSRFASTAMALGLKEGDFNHFFTVNPLEWEFPNNAVVIIDWLLVKNKAETDAVFQKLIEKLNKANGFLIIFQQLKKDGGWYAENMADLFPCLAAKYFYEEGSNGERGFWDVRPIRAPKGGKSANIPCYYDTKSKRLLPVTEAKKGSSPLASIPRPKVGASFTK